MKAISPAYKHSHTTLVADTMSRGGVHTHEKIQARTDQEGAHKLRQDVRPDLPPWERLPPYYRKSDGDGWVEVRVRKGCGAVNAEAYSESNHHCNLPYYIRRVYMDGRWCPTPTLPLQQNRPAIFRSVTL